MVIGLIRFVFFGGLLTVALGPFIFIGLIIVSGMVANYNLQQCWIEHGVTFYCNGEGVYDPNRGLSRPR